MWFIQRESVGGGGVSLGRGETVGFLGSGDEPGRGSLPFLMLRLLDRDGASSGKSELPGEEGLVWL